LELAYRFRGSVHYHHGGKHGSIQADVVLEELRVLHFDPKAARRRLSFHTGWSLNKEDLKACLYSVTCFFQQGHNS
jgi:phenylalanyl-tRNA synthetase beta subunit